MVDTVGLVMAYGVSFPAEEQAAASRTMSSMLILQKEPGIGMCAPLSLNQTFLGGS